jgi:hypothetical protein
LDDERVAVFFAWLMMIIVRGRGTDGRGFTVKIVAVRGDSQRE